jgi:glycosyltransferase involved in cell wall biosynthesis
VGRQRVAGRYNGAMDRHGGAADRPPAVSVIATVYNEVATVAALIEALAGQTRRPDEVVIVDGGSTDGTWEALQASADRGGVPLVALSRPGAGISAGRNAAIAAARGPVIASTDAGVRLVPEWLAALTAPIAGGARFVAGFFESDPRGAFETALGATTLPERRDVEPDRFLPSSRSVAFRKDDWAAVGGYPEWLDYCEDLVFDIRLEACAGRPVFVPEAVARFRPRPTLSAFFRQYYRYARGDGKADLWPARHAVRYGTYLLAGPALLALARWVHPAFALLVAGGLVGMVATPYRRLVRQWAALAPGERVAAAAWVPVVRVAGDVAKMLGYPAGRRWRRSHQPPAWQPATEGGTRRAGDL